MSTDQEEVPSIPLEMGKGHDRITLLTTVYHERVGYAAQGAQGNGELKVSLNEEAYHRSRAIGDLWQPIQFGHFDADQVGCIVVHNLEGVGAQVHPTEEEKLALPTKIIEVGTPDSLHKILVRPGWAVPLPLDNYEQLQIRCQIGQAKCRISIFPK